MATQGNYLYQKTATVYTSTSTTTIFNAIAASFTPKSTGRILVHLVGNTKNDTSLKGATVTLKYGTGAVPVVNSSTSGVGTQIGGLATNSVGNGANVNYYFQISDYIQLIPGITYWFDTGLSTTSAGSTATMAGYSLCIVEFSNDLGLTSQFTQPSSPAGTNNIFPGVMMGLGSTMFITPNKSGRVLFLFNGQYSNGTNGKGGSTYCYYGTGTAPANQAALTGTQFNQQLVLDAVQGASSGYPFMQNGIVVGLAIGTKYWFDTGMNATGANSNLADLYCQLIEF